MISWNYHAHADCFHGKPVHVMAFLLRMRPCTEYVSILIHQLKEQLLQSFFNRSELQVLRGTASGNRVMCSSSVLSHSLLVSHNSLNSNIDMSSLKHCLCWIRHGTTHVNAVGSATYGERNRVRATLLLLYQYH